MGSTRVYAYVSREPYSYGKSGLSWRVKGGVRRRVVKRGTHDDVTCVHDDVTWFGGEWSREGHMKYRVPEVPLMLCDRVYHLCVCVCVCVFVCVCVSCMCCVCIYTLSVNSKQDTRGDEQVAVISPIHTLEKCTKLTSSGSRKQFDVLQGNLLSIGMI